MGVNSPQLRDAIETAIADLGEAKDLAAMLELEFAFDISPSEILADKAREALENRDEPPPRNWRERLSRRARDAAIETAISSMERAGKKQEEIVKDLLKDMAQDVQDFAKEKAGEWEQFFMENAEDLEEFMDDPAVDQLLEDPLSVITKEYWAENGDALRELLKDMEAEEFLLGQLADADEFLKQIAEDARESVEESFGFLLDTVRTVLTVAERFGLDPLESMKKQALNRVEEAIDRVPDLTGILPPPPPLWTLVDFLDNPLGFMKKQALKRVDELTGSEKGEGILKFLKDGAKSLELSGSNDRRRQPWFYFDNHHPGCWEHGVTCVYLACLKCCRGYYGPWYWFGGGQCV